MTVDFYTITDGNNVLHKTLPISTKTTLSNVDVFRPSNIENPQIICDNFANVASKNYCYISKYGRYYFITGITFVSAQRCIIDLSVDVLKTYENSIINCIGTATRSESAGINYIVDNRYPLNSVHRKIDIINYSKTPFTRSPNKPYILTTIGGTVA